MKPGSLTTQNLIQRLVSECRIDPNALTKYGNFVVYLMKQQNTTLLEVKKAVDALADAPHITDKLRFLETQAFAKGVCQVAAFRQTEAKAKRTRTAQVAQKPAGVSVSYHVDGYERARDWFDSLLREQRDLVWQGLTQRLMELRHDNMLHSPLSYALGQAYLVSAWHQARRASL